LDGNSILGHAIVKGLYIVCGLSAMDFNKLLQWVDTLSELILEKKPSLI